MSSSETVLGNPAAQQEPSVVVHKQVIGDKPRSQFADAVSRIPVDVAFMAYGTFASVDHILLTEALSGIKVAIVGLYEHSVEELQKELFGNVGPRLADVAAATYRIPRVVDADQQAKDAAAMALLTQWLEDDHDPAEARQWETFKAELDADRPASRKLFS